MADIKVKFGVKFALLSTSSNLIFGSADYYDNRREDPCIRYK